MKLYSFSRWNSDDIMPKFLGFWYSSLLSNLTLKFSVLISLSSGV